MGLRSSWLGRGGLLLAAALASACKADLAVPGDARISCQDTADCPEGQRCRADNHRCADPNDACLQREGDLLVPAPDGNQCALSDQAQGSCLGGSCGAHCGDGLFSEGLEPCDAGGDTALCDADCTLPLCGDGRLNRAANEECDDGADSAACGADCRLKARLDLGGRHSCLVLEGFVKCWGADNAGQLGLPGNDLGWQPGEMGANLPPVDLASLGTVLGVAAGLAHTCALSSAGALACWGDGTLGQIGNGQGGVVGDDDAEMGTALLPVDLGVGALVVQVAAGTYHTCAALADGSVRCFGENSYGSLGLGSGFGNPDPALVFVGDDPGEMGAALAPVDLGQDAFATRVAAGANFTCALLDDGTVKCWGVHLDGRLGDEGAADQTVGGSPADMGDNLPRVDLGTLASVTALVAGDDHMCALLTTGGLKCWGENASGQLGYGHTNDLGDQLGEMGDDLPEVDLGQGNAALAIAAGSHHTCALLAGGAVKCWGGNAMGQLGLGDVANRGDGPAEMGDALPAVDLGTAAVAVSLAAGDYHSCAWLDDGRVKCWGRNQYGSLGLGDVEDRGDEPGEMGEQLPAVDVGPVN